MAWYLRKAFRFGPFRLNLSRSGLGVSAGVTGARIGLGPRGAYVHAGRGGLYLRQPLGGGGLTAAPGAVPPPSTARDPEAIESAAVSELTDTASAELLAALGAIHRRWDVFPGVAVLTGATGVIAVWSASPAWIAAVIALAILAVYARHYDVTRGTYRLEYDLAPEAVAAFEHLARSFEGFAGCGAVWHVGAKAAVLDRKREAGAESAVARQRVAPGLALPRRIQCNIVPPSLPAGRQVLYLFPDRVFVFDPGGVGAVPFGQLRSEAGDTRFVEDESVPADAEVVGRTWRYVNKKGGPDQRFRDNPELPVVRYGTLHLTSDSGLNELFHCSRPGAAAELARALSGYTDRPASPPGQPRAPSPSAGASRFRSREEYERWKAEKFGNAGRDEGGSP